jgi:hypothetical protein
MEIWDLWDIWGHRARITYILLSFEVSMADLYCCHTCPEAADREQAN